MLKEKENNIAIVFGGRSPIALSCARRLGEYQHVILVTRSIDEGIIQEIGGSQAITLVEADLEVAGEGSKIIQKIYQVGKKVTSIIFLQRYRPKEKSDYHSHVAVELWSIKEVLETLKDLKALTESVQVIVSSSPAANRVLFDQDLNYHIIKASQESLVRYYAIMLAKSHIYVNAVRIGSIVIKERAMAYWQSIPRTFSVIKQMSLSGEVMTSEALGDIISSLVISFTPGITGQIYELDNGFSLRDQSQLMKGPLESIERGFYE